MSNFLKNNWKWLAVLAIIALPIISARNAEKEAKYQKNLEIIKQREAEEAYAALPQAEKDKIEAQKKAQAEEQAKQQEENKKQLLLQAYRDCENRRSGNDVYSTVINDALDQYNIVKQHGSQTEICVHSGLVSAAILQAKDNFCYEHWQHIETNDCAGLQ